MSIDLTKQQRVRLSLSSIWPLKIIGLELQIVVRVAFEILCHLLDKQSCNRLECLDYRLNSSLTTEPQFFLA
jgi:hypothetical protein